MIQTASCCFHWSCASFLQRAAHGAPDQTAGCAQDSRCRAPLIRSCQLECGLWRGAISGLEFLLEKWRGEWEGGSRWWIKITMDPTFAKSPTTSARVLDSRGTVPLGFLIPTSTTNVCVCVCLCAFGSLLQSLHSWILGRGGSPESMTQRNEVACELQHHGAGCCPLWHFLCKSWETRQLQGQLGPKGPKSQRRTQRRAWKSKRLEDCQKGVRLKI